MKFGSWTYNGIQVNKLYTATKIILTPVFIASPGRFKTHGAAARQQFGQNWHRLEGILLLGRVGHFGRASSTK